MRGDSPVRHKEYTSKNALHEVLLRARYNRTTYIWGLLNRENIYAVQNRGKLLPEIKACPFIISQ